MPNPEYMDGQNDLTSDMRQTLVDWLLQVHLRYHMLPETIWIVINIIDRFLTKRVISIAKLHFVGITAIFIAAKYEEIQKRTLSKFLTLTWSSRVSVFDYFANSSREAIAEVVGRLRDNVSPPYHHVRTRESSSLPSAHPKMRTSMDTKHTSPRKHRALIDTPPSPLVIVMPRWHHLDPYLCFAL